MRAMVIRPDEDTLQLRDVPPPEPGERELLVAVEASGVNRADLLQRRGKYEQAAFSDVGGVRIAGMEAAGEVVGLGRGVTGFKIGDRVMGICAGGCAEFVTLDQRLALPVPDHLDQVSAGALPLGLMTEYDALANAGRLRAGETVLVTAASSGVGLIGIQVARALGAGRVLATVRSGDGRAAVLECGADEAIDVGEEWPASIPDVDVAIDHVGGPALTSLLAGLNVGGRLVSVGRLGGRSGELDMNLLARDRLHLIGVTFRTRTRTDVAEIAAGAARDLGDPLRAGALRPVVTRTFPLAEALTAQEFARGPRPPGKVVITVTG